MSSSPVTRGLLMYRYRRIGGGAGGGPGGRVPRRDVPMAERERRQRGVLAGSPDWGDVCDRTT